MQCWPLRGARNAGFRASRGEFVAVLDADDLVAPGYYPRALEILRRYDELGFVGCWAQYFGASANAWPTWNPEPPYLLAHNTMNSSALVYRRRDLLAHGLGGFGVGPRRQHRLCVGGGKGDSAPDGAAWAFIHSRRMRQRGGGARAGTDGPRSAASLRRARHNTRPARMESGQ